MRRRHLPHTLILVDDRFDAHMVVVTTWIPGFRRRRLLNVVLGLCFVTAGALLLRAGDGGAQDRSATMVVVVLEVRGPIGPATADYLARGFEKAEDQGAGLIVLHMDTPGGLADSMRVIIQEILSSSIPVATFVAPQGSRAASAGTYILYASHIAAMAPGTNLGAATPVQIGGGGFPGQPQPQPQDDQGSEDEDAAERPRPRAGMEEKIVNDSAAYIRSLAQLRNRNAEWAERAVREAASLSASEALEQDVIDLVARDLSDLLARLDGRTVEIGDREVVFETAAAELSTIEPDWRVRLLSILTNPNVAYILMLIGIYGIIFEFYSPGLIFPGVTGAISLLLALYAFQVLPVNYAGLALIGVGIAMMIGEMMMPSFGALGVGGIIAFVAGSIMLMDTDLPGFQIAWQVVGGIALSGALVLMALISVLAQSRRRAVVSGQEEMVGRLATVVEWAGRAGRVRIHGEVWFARSGVEVQPGTKVRITAVDGLTLEVEPQGEGET